MKSRVAAMALLAPLLPSAIVAPRLLSVALCGPFPTRQPAIAAPGVVTPSAKPAAVAAPAEQAGGNDGEVGGSGQPAPSFVGPGWG